MISRKLSLTFGAMAFAFFLLLDRQPVSAQNTENGRATRYRVADRGRGLTDAYLRSGRKSFTLGTLFEREHFDVQYRTNNYAWGYAHGDAERCGWMVLSDNRGRILTPVSRRGEVRPLCPDPPRGPNGALALGVFMAPVSGDPQRTHDKNSITCADGGESACDGTETTLKQATTLFRNIRNGRGVQRRSLQIPATQPGTNGGQQKVKWRYVATGRAHTLVKAIVNGKRYWGFVRIDHLDARPVDRNCTIREACNR